MLIQRKERQDVCIPQENELKAHSKEAEGLYTGGEVTMGLNKSLVSNESLRVREGERGRKESYESYQFQTGLWRSEKG